MKQAAGSFPGLHTDPAIDPGAAPSLLLCLLSLIGSNLTALLGTVCRPAGDARVLEITSKTRAFLISEGSGLVTKRECVHKVFCASVCCALPDQQSM